MPRFKITVTTSKVLRKPLVIVTNRRMHDKYWGPQADGRYATVTTAHSGEILTVKQAVGLSLEVNDILGLSHSSSES